MTLQQRRLRSNATADNAAYVLTHVPCIRLLLRLPVCCPAQNYFYQDVESDWLCLKMTRATLDAAGMTLKFEDPSPVGSKKALTTKESGGERASFSLEACRVVAGRLLQSLLLLSLPVAVSPASTRVPARCALRVRTAHGSRRIPGLSSTVLCSRVLCSYSVLTCACHTVGFPHIYGGIPASGGVVVQEYKVHRGPNGEYLSIEGLAEGAPVPTPSMTTTCLAGVSRMLARVPPSAVACGCAGVVLGLALSKK